MAKTITNKILDYVERKGSCTWTEINKFHTFGCRGITSEEAKYDGVRDRGGPLGYNLPKMCIPVRGRNRFLQKGTEGHPSSKPGCDGRYRVRYLYHKLYDKLYKLRIEMRKWYDYGTRNAKLAPWEMDDHTARMNMLTSDINACEGSFKFVVPRSSLKEYNEWWKRYQVVK